LKGFIRILEAIIASIIILAAMTFFLTPDVIKTGWDGPLIQIQSQDVLYALYKNSTLQECIRANNKTKIDAEITKFFSKSIGFSIEVNGLPNPEIYIGCNCTDSQINDLKTMLSPLDFKYNERNISIRVANESVDNIRNETDVLFIFGYKNLNPFRNKLSKFFERGGTVFILGDLTKAQIEDGYINDTFGLKWNSIGDPTPNGEFFDTENPGNASYKVSKYFVNISGSPKTTLFQNFNRLPSINHVSIDNNTITKDQGGTFSFVKVNKGLGYGNGRTVWFSDFTPSSDFNTTKLLKAGIMWASGEEYVMDPYKKTYPENYIKTKYLIFDKDAYEIRLTIWKVFY
jgi:hypothetical protein